MLEAGFSDDPLKAFFSCFKASGRGVKKFWSSFLVHYMRADWLFNTEK